MSQEIQGKTDAAEARTHETRGFMQQVRVAAWDQREGRRMVISNHLTGN